jgi:hypothetical protein
MSTFYKFKYENVIEMKNKPDLAILRTSYLSNEIKKDTQISIDHPFNLFTEFIFSQGFYILTVSIQLTCSSFGLAGTSSKTVRGQ